MRAVGRRDAGDGLRYEHRDRVGDRGFHHAWMPTSEYRARFGHWSYETDRGTSFVVTPPGSQEAQLVGFKSAWITADDGTQVAVSPGLLAVGTVHLTAHIHEHFVAGMVEMLAQHYRSFMENAASRDPKDQEWRREKRALVELCERYEDDQPALEQALAEERARQRAELRATLELARAWLAAR